MQRSRRSQLALAAKFGGLAVLVCYVLPNLALQCALRSTAVTMGPGLQAAVNRWFWPIVYWPDYVLSTTVWIWLVEGLQLDIAGMVVVTYLLPVVGWFVAGALAAVTIARLWWPRETAW